MNSDMSDMKMSPDFLFVDDMLEQVHMLRSDLVRHISTLREVEAKHKTTKDGLLNGIREYSENVLSMDESVRSDMLIMLREKMNTMHGDIVKRSMSVRGASELISSCIGNMQPEYDRIVPKDPEKAPHSTLVKALLQKVALETDMDRSRDYWRFHEDKNEEIVEGSGKNYCWCQKVGTGEMIGCDGKGCKFEWFHLKCMGLESNPPKTGKWFCPDCRKKL